MTDSLANDLGPKLGDFSQGQPAEVLPQKELSPNFTRGKSGLGLSPEVHRNRESVDVIVNGSRDSSRMSTLAQKEKAPSTSLTAVSAVSKTQVKRVFKVIIIGDPNVGKTCLSFRFCNGRFPQSTEATIGVDFRERALTIDGETLRVQLWDTAGQERFRQSMVSHYYRNVHAVVFVYDMTKGKTFQNLFHWVEECQKHAVKPREIPMILIGNKCDVQDQVCVPTNEAQKFADHQDMPLFETSAKMDSESDHVEAIFMTLVHKLKDCKAIHVQSEQERASFAGEKKILRVAEQEPSTESSGGCAC